MKRNLLTQIFSLFLLFSIVLTGLVQTAPAQTAKTRIIDTVTDTGGNPRSGVVTFILTQKSAVGPAGLIAAKATITASLDSNGRFDVSVYPSRSLSPASYYQVWFKDGSTANQELLGVYDIPSSSTNISLSGYKVTDTNLAAQYTFASKTDVDRLTVATATAVLNPSTITNSLGYVPLKPSLNLSELTSASAARANLGLGSMATQNASNVNITGGSLNGITCVGCTNIGIGSSGGVANTADTVIAAGTGGSGGRVSVQTHGGLERIGVEDNGSVSIPGTTTTQVIDKGGQVVNVLSTGADNTGATSVTTAVTNAINALPASGGTVFFPAGTFKIGSGSPLPYNLKSNITFKGAGIGATILTYDTNAGAFFSNSGSASVSNLAFEDLTFSYIGSVGPLGTGLNLSQSNLSGPVRVSRCKFVGESFAMIATPDTVSNVLIEDSVFSAWGGTSYGVVFQNQGSHNIEVRNCTFRFLLQAIKIGGYPADLNGDFQSENVRIHNNYVEGGFSILKENFSGEGGTVSYTSTAVVDTSANFTNITTGAIVRAMAVRGSANLSGATFSQNLIDLPSATFTTWGVARGQIVKTSGGKFGVVANVLSQTQIRVEEWLNGTDRQPAAVPAAGETVTIFGMVFGSVSSFTATQINVPRWYGLTGQPVVVPNGTRYELSKNVQAQQILVSAQGSLVYSNFLKRAFDGITLSGRRGQAFGNILFDTYDTGITVQNASEVSIHNNDVARTGSNGMLFDNSNDSMVQNNRCVDSGLVVPSGTMTANIYWLKSSRGKVSGNKLYQVESANITTRAVVVEGIDGSNQASGNRVLDNEPRGHTPSLPFYVTANGVSGAAQGNQFNNNGSAPDIQGGATATAYDYVDSGTVRHMSSLPVTP